MARNATRMLAVLAILLPVVVFSGCQRTPHQRLGWKADDYFADKGVLSLCKAIEAKDIAEIDRLVKSGVDINAKGQSNMTPLLWAFPMGEAVFGKMLELGADPNVKLTCNVMLSGLTVGKSVTWATVELTDGPIYHEFFYDVCMDNYLKSVLDHGGNANIEDLGGRTPIFFPDNYRHMNENLRILLAHGAEINHRDCQGMTPAMAAMPFRDFTLTLLKAGADYRIADNEGLDLILDLEFLKMPSRTGALMQSGLDRDAGLAKPVFEWLTREGVNWKAAHAAWESKETMRNLKNVPADYKHRPWLPQRPTLKKPDAKM